MVENGNQDTKPARPYFAKTLRLTIQDNPEVPLVTHQQVQEAIYGAQGIGRALIAVHMSSRRSVHTRLGDRWTDRLVFDVEISFDLASIPWKNVPDSSPTTGQTRRRDPKLHLNEILAALETLKICVLYVQ